MQGRHDAKSRSDSTVLCPAGALPCTPHPPGGPPGDFSRGLESHAKSHITPVIRVGLFEEFFFAVNEEKGSRLLSSQVAESFRERNGTSRNGKRGKTKATLLNARASARIRAMRNVFLAYLSGLSSPSERVGM